MLSVKDLLKPFDELDETTKFHNLLSLCSVVNIKPVFVVKNGKYVGIRKDV